MLTRMNKWHWIFSLFIHALVLSPVSGQTVIDSIIRPGLAPAGLAVYETGNKLCVFDDRTNHLLIYDGATLALGKEIVFSHPPDDPFSYCGMAVNEAEGELYIGIGTRPDVRVAIVDLTGDSVLTEIPVPNLLPQSADGFVLDPVLNKLFLNNFNEVFILDLSTNAVIKINLPVDGMHIDMSLNPVTHEVFLANGVAPKLRIINGINNQLSEMNAVKAFAMTVNWLENKVYIIAFPYSFWIYDRDNGTIKTIDHHNDAEHLKFNPGSNLVYTDAEIACQTTIFDGSSDNYYNLPMQGATSVIGFRFATKHAYFVHSNFIGVFDEGSQMFEKIQFSNPHADQGGSNQLIAINQTTGRVFVSHVQFYDSPDYNPVWVLQDTETMNRPNILLHDISLGKYEIIDPKSHEAVEYWNGNYPEFPARGIAFRPDGGRIYCVTHSLNSPSGELEVHAGSGAWDKIGISAGNFNARIGSLNLDAQLPKSIVPSPDGSKVYIPCSASNKVLTVDVTIDSSLVITNELNAGISPWGCAITPDGTKLYVTNKGSNTVSVINTTTNNVADTIRVGTEPWGIALNPAGTLAYVANSGSNSISVIHIPADSVIETIPVGNLPIWLTFTPDGKYVFVTNNGSGTVSMIDAGTHEVLNSIPVGLHPEGICVYPDGSEVYVATDSTACAIHTSDLSVLSIDRTTVNKGKKNIVAISNCTSRIAGRVQNTNNQPVANATVKAFRDGTELETLTTNASGDYSIFTLNKGTYDIEATAPDYYPQNLTSQSTEVGRIKICHFYLVPFVPSIPVLASPLNNSTNQPLREPLLWHKSPVAYSYHLQISEDSLFQVLIYNDSIITDTTKQVSNLNPATSYYWRVKAKNESGVSNWSDAWSFTTQSTPMVFTASVTEITTSTATGGGSITNDGGAFVTERGLCWSTQPNPSIIDYRIVCGKDTGDFTGTMSGLIPNTNYHVRAFAVNSAGTAYGENISFSTSNTSVNTPEENVFTIYPNPNDGICYIALHKNCFGEVIVELADIAGKKVKTFHFLKNGEPFYEKIEFTELHPGFYIIHIYSSHSVFVRNIIKNH